MRDTPKESLFGGILVEPRLVQAGVSIPKPFCFGQGIRQDRIMVNQKKKIGSGEILLDPFHALFGIRKLLPCTPQCLGQFPYSDSLS
jgi:hypothetical protein